ncbi:unnamed protein product [Trichobilharzia szidati]|nr:unnamed protein product [Trichobilharzia szidati]
MTSNITFSEVENENNINKIKITPPGLNKKTKNLYYCSIFMLVILCLLLIAGISMIIYGGFLIWSKQTVDSYTGQYINATLVRLHGKNITLLRPIVLNAALDYTGIIGTGFFLWGMFLIMIIGCGIWGILMKKYMAMYLFTAVVFAKCLIMFIMALCFAINPVTMMYSFKTLTTEYVENYVSSTSIDHYSLLLNVLMAQAGCCGVENGEDFAEAKYMQERYKFANRIKYNVLKYPYTCCKYLKSFEAFDPSCPESFNELNSNVRIGCWPIIEKYLTTLYGKITIGVCFVLIVLLIMACCSIYVGSSFEKGDYISIKRTHK